MEEAREVNNEISFLHSFVNGWMIEHISSVGRWGNVEDPTANPFKSGNGYCLQIAVDSLRGYDEGIFCGMRITQFQLLCQ
jgi:hypothetical protein